MGEALKASVAAEHDAVLKRFENADQLLGDGRKASTPEAKDLGPTDVPAGVTRLAYSLPPQEAVMVQDMLLRAAQAGQLVNRSELVRAALHVLSALPESAFEEALRSVAKLKPGRPAGS